MITVIATFKLPKPLSLQEAKAIFQSTAPKYQDQQGLVRKYYILSEDGTTAGGVYLWRSREEAEALYTDDWKAFIQSKYGSEPSLVYMQSPVIVDNTTHQVLSSWDSSTRGATGWCWSCPACTNGSELTSQVSWMIPAAG